MLRPAPGRTTFSLLALQAAANSPLEDLPVRRVDLLHRRDRNPWKDSGRPARSKASESLTLDAIAGIDLRIQAKRYETTHLMRIGGLLGLRRGRPPAFIATPLSIGTTTSGILTEKTHLSVLSWLSPVELRSHACSSAQTRKPREAAFSNRHDRAPKGYLAHRGADRASIAAIKSSSVLRAEKSRLGCSERICKKKMRKF